MRAFGVFLLVLAGALFAAAVLVYPAWLLVGLIDQQPIHRVMHRLAMLAALGGFVYLWRRYELADKQSLGYALPRREFIRQLLMGSAAGVAIIAPLIALLFVTGARSPIEGAYQDAPLLLKLVVGGLASGLAIALIEETFFRGALFTAIRRESGALLAVLLPSALYASLHFLGGRLKIPVDQIGWGTGFAVLGEMFDKYATPVALIDSFLSLFCIGVLLALTRMRTGAIATSIGMHAAWVAAIAFTRGTSRINADAPVSWLVGSYDGVLGWGALGYILIIAAAYFALRGMPPARGIS